MRVTVYNKNLNPQFWSPDKILKEEIKSALLKIAKIFLKDINLKVHIRDIYFLGSSANYNWTNSSDIDLHILIDLNDLPMTPVDAKEYTKLLAKKWNEEQDIHIKNHNVEVYIQDVNEVNRSTGVYSLTSGRWVKEAVPQRVVLDKTLIQQKYTTWKQRINDVIKTKNVDELKSVLKDLTSMREAGLTSSGEFSTENLVFKILRQSGLIGRLKKAIQSVKNTDLSVNDGFDPLSFGPNTTSTSDPFDPEYYKKENERMRKM